jgi:hypothetical protein
MQVFKEMTVTRRGQIRNISPEDWPAITEIINKTWQDYEFYEPMTAEGFNELIHRTPEYNNGSIWTITSRVNNATGLNPGGGPLKSVGTSVKTVKSTNTNMKATAR